MGRLRILLVQVALGVVFLEICLKIYDPVPFRIRGNRIVLPIRQQFRFSQDGSAKLDATATNTKNSLGFRGPEPPRDFRRRLTLVTIGGSTTECMLLTDGKTWTDVLAGRLRQIDPSAWVNNAGFDGQSTFGHVVLLRDFVARLQPSAAVFLVGINEEHLAAWTSYDGRLAPSRTAAQTVGAFLVEHVELAALASNFLNYAHAHYLGYGNNEVDFKAIPHAADSAADIAAAVEAERPYLAGFDARLHELTDISRAHGIEPVFVTQPAMFGDAIDPATGIDLSTARFRGRRSGALEWRVLEAYNDVTRRAAAATGVFLIDLARELPKDSDLFYDYMHYSNAGAQRVGIIVADRLLPHVEGRASR